MPDLPPTYATVLGLGLAASACTALASAFALAPYGRFASQQLGPNLPIRWGWVLMEILAIPVYLGIFLTAEPPTTWVPWLFLALWCVHYGNRGLFFPLSMKVRAGGTMGAVVVGSGAVVVAAHAWLYATWVASLGTHLQSGHWHTDPRFALGLLTYLTGLGLILHSEAVLRSLRSERVVTDEDAYKIPQRGAFRWVSSPHYLGELLAWTGLMIATWCPGGLFILTISAANLIPRAASVHRWYRERFAEYPAARKALVPYLW